MRMFLLLIAALGCLPAWAESVSIQSSARTRPWSDDPIGVGLMSGNSFGAGDHALVIEGQNHFNQRRGEFDLSRYGEGQTRLEIGTGVGMTAASTGGVGLIGLQGFDRVAPFVGIEPFNGRVSLNTNDSRTDFYGWYPMASAGPQFAFGTCRVLSVARAGGAIGNLGKPGLMAALTPAYGASGFVNCWRFDAMAEWTRVIGHDLDHDLAAVDTAYQVTPRGWKLGLRAESIKPRSVEAQGQELRAMVLVRGAFF